MWDSVPWFVGGGATHSPEIARLLAYAATSGAEGIVAPGDLKVVPLDVAGSSVRALAGACLILNRAAGGEQQTYVGRNPSADPVAIPATGSSSGTVSRMVVAAIEDPFLAGSPFQTPSDVTKGPYIFTRLLPNVPASAIASPAAALTYVKSLNLSAIPLAGISQPANTATITAAMLRDLRQMALPRESRVIQQAMPTAGQQLTSTAWVAWPTTKFLVTVPTWANYFYMESKVGGYEVSSASATAGDTKGGLRATFGPLVSAEQIYDHNGANYMNGARFSATVGTNDWCSALQGQTVEVGLQGYRASGFPGYLRTWSGLHLSIDVQFYERPV